MNIILILFISRFKNLTLKLDYNSHTYKYDILNIKFVKNDLIGLFNYVRWKIEILIKFFILVFIF
jgi:hypothetical protein